MKFGITMFPTDHAVVPSRFGQLVESHGFDAVYFGEHTHTPVDRSSPYPSGGNLPEDFYRFHDPIESLAATAAVTTRIELGTGTLVIPNHDPIMLAKRLSTLDHLSNGRLIVGVGAGWNLEEMANHGTDPATRWTVFRERVEAVREIWTHEIAEYNGSYVQFKPLYQWPKPVQKPHPPIYVGGSGPGTEKRVLRFGDGWLVSGRHLDGDELATRVRALRALADEQGRGPIPAMIQQGTPTPQAIERYLSIGLRCCTLRVDPGDEGHVTAQLETLAALIEPYAEREANQP
jgi:probable F420-dependent oxidoreductase